MSEDWTVCIGLWPKNLSDAFYSVFVLKAGTEACTDSWANLHKESHHLCKV